MRKKALVIIDIQNDITKHYKEIIGHINQAIDWAVEHEIHVVYIRHYNLSAGTRTFKPDTVGAQLVPEMKIVSDNIFIKSKGNALTSEAFADFPSLFLHGERVALYRQECPICLVIGVALGLILAHAGRGGDHEHCCGVAGGDAV